MGTAVWGYRTQSWKASPEDVNDFGQGPSRKVVLEDGAR